MRLLLRIKTDMADVGPNDPGIRTMSDYRIDVVARVRRNDAMRAAQAKLPS
jgi:hypothetical protein